MLHKITINVLTMFLLTLNSTQLFAQSGYDKMQTQSGNHHLVPQPKPSRISSLQRVFIESRLYEYLLTHPGFIKIQDMAQRVWDNQTGVKRRVSYSKRKIFTRRIE